MHCYRCVGLGCVEVGKIEPELLVLQPRLPFVLPTWPLS